jgi:hypothetical protein
VDTNGYLVQKNVSTGQRWRERAKKFATVFYGWMLWTDFDAWLNSKSGSHSSAVLGAGRELVQEADFDVNRPRVRDATVFYQHLAKAVQGSGARLQIVYFPLSYIIHPEDESRWRHLGVKNVEAQSAFDAAFVNYLSERHIPTVDITEDLRNAATHGKRLYYWLDIHWTPEGNAVAARAVAGSIIRARPNVSSASTINAAPASNGSWKARTR